MLFAGIDLAWSEGVRSKKPQETGAVVLDAQGTVLHADWTVGVTDAVEWVQEHVPEHADALLFVDAPLVVNNHVGQRVCETQVGRPRYKRKPRRMSSDAFRPIRAGECDELIRRISRLPSWVSPPNLQAYPATGALVAEPSPLQDAQYKHREDLLDAVICAWTALLWASQGGERCQVLGCEDAESGGLRATIVAPARTEQRRAVAGA